MTTDISQLTLPSIPPELKELRLSVSKVKTFLQCKKMFYYTYIMKLPRKEFEFHLLGKAIHLVLELFHSDLLNGSTLPLNKLMANAYKISMDQFGPKMIAASRKEVFTMADQYLKRITSDKGQIKTVLSVEKNFALDIGGKVILNGMIDKVQTDHDGVLHVMDYKSTKNKKYLKNDWLQLLTYAYILYTENQHVERIRGSYVLLRHGFEHITKEFSLPEILDIKNRFETYAKEISEATLYPATPTRLCEWCLAIDRCDEGREFLGIGSGEVNW